MTATDALFIFGLIILAILAWLFIPVWMIKRNVPKVIKIFEKKNAIGPENAKTIEELGLKPKSMLQRMFSRRDYKPKALDFLIQANVVQIKEDGKVFITEETARNRDNLLQFKFFKRKQ